MKQFIHEKFLESNPEIKIADLPESLRKKIDKWNETKADVYSMKNAIKRNEHIPKLDELSYAIMEEIQEEVEPEEEPAPASIPPAKNDDEPPKSPAKKDDDTELDKNKPKKKSSNVFAWVLGGILVAITGVAIYSEMKDQKKNV